MDEQNQQQPVQPQVITPGMVPEAPAPVPAPLPTINECTKILRQSGAARADAVVFARTPTN